MGVGFRAPRKEQILPSGLGSIFQRTGPRAINNPGTVIASRASCPGSGLGAAAASPRRARGRSGSADPQGAPNPPCPGWNSPGCSIRTLEPGQINNRRLEGAPAAVVKALLGRVCTVPRLQMSRRGIFSPPRIQDSGMQPFPGRSLSLAMTPPPSPPRCATARLYKKNLEVSTRIPAGEIAPTWAPGALPTGVGPAWPVPITG